MIFLLGFIFLNSPSPVNCAVHKCSNDKWCVELNNCQEWCGKIEQVGSVSGLLDDLGELDVSTEFDCIETRECGGTEQRARGFCVEKALRSLMQAVKIHPEFKGRNSQPEFDVAALRMDKSLSTRTSNRCVFP